jgi:hypothetical protein
MKNSIFALAFVGSLFVSSAAMADADDVKWVAQCLKDNKDASVAVEIVTKYCTCMNNKMSSDETQSISTWEKSHPTERTACDKEAGWK